jgi:hypothetical protein
VPVLRERLAGDGELSAVDGAALVVGEVFLAAPTVRVTPCSRTQVDTIPVMVDALGMDLNAAPTTSTWTVTENVRGTRIDRGACPMVTTDNNLLIAKLAFCFLDGVNGGIFTAAPEDLRPAGGGAYIACAPVSDGGAVYTVRQNSH